MGMFKRFVDILRAKANKLLDRVEDPRDTLDLTYEKQVENLQSLRRSLATVATARKRVEIQADQLRRRVATLQDQARQALGQGREDLARQALTRRAALDADLADLDSHLAQMAGQQRALQATATRVGTQVAAFRTRKETLKATYSAAEAQTRVGEAVLGISSSVGDAGAVIERATDKITHMQARAGAIDELMASGTLPDATGTRDDIQARLDRAGATGAVERELAALRAELAMAPSALGPSPATPPGLHRLASPIPDTPHEVNT